MTVGAALLTGGLVAGWAGAGLALGLLVLILGLRARFGPRTGEVAGRGAAALALLASLGYLFRPWQSPEGWAGDLDWVSYLALASVLGVALLSSRPRLGVARRMKGSSTAR